MLNLQNKKRSAYINDGDLASLEETLKDYWDRARDLESETINDLEKHLWLANGAAATVSIGYIQANDATSLIQYYGAWAFVSGILALVVLKFLSATISSRDTARLQEAKSRFDAEEVTDMAFSKVRDSVFNILKRCYLFLQWGSGFAFISGCVLTLIGVRGAL